MRLRRIPSANLEWDPCAKKYSCHSRNSCSKKFMVTSVFKNLVFKTSRESIEIHHWSIPHCGKPQQFNIQHSKLNIALRVSAWKDIRVIRVITSLRSVGLRRISCSKKYRVRSVFKNLVFNMWAHCLITNYCCPLKLRHTRMRICMDM